MPISGRLIRDELIFCPHVPRTASKFGLSYGESIGGYDVCLAQKLVIPPQGFVLGSIYEHMIMPNHLIGVVHDKSTNARLGITLQNTVIEPGWRGYLTVEITNHLPKKWWGNAKRTAVLPAGYPIAQILLHPMTGEIEQGYDGKYQNQKGEPTEAKLLLPTL